MVVVVGVNSQAGVLFALLGATQKEAKKENKKTGNSLSLPFPGIPFIHVSTLTLHFIKVQIQVQYALLRCVGLGLHISHAHNSDGDM